MNSNMPAAHAGGFPHAGQAVNNEPLGTPRLPLIDLHDHLDGGLRPRTVIDLARECGYAALPTYDSDALADWFVSAANSGSLERFLETFAHTVAVLQTPAALERVAAEAVIDIARDGVGWAEIRMAPELCENQKLSMDDAVAAMLTGLREGERAARAEGHDIAAGLIICAMRQTDRADDVARVLQRHLDAGVVGFDIAGPEAGFPPLRLASAFDLVRQTGAHITVHAGEADGVESIRQALAVGAQRLGHGVRITQDVSISANGKTRLGDVACEVRDRGIALEVCPTSNVQTGAVISLGEHPLRVLDELGFVTTINPDNRLMCGVKLSDEMSLAAAMIEGNEASPGGDRDLTLRESISHRAYATPDGEWREADFARWTRNAIAACFAPDATKRDLEARFQMWQGGAPDAPSNAHL